MADVPIAIDPRVEALLVQFDKTQNATDAEMAAMRRAISESPYLAQRLLGENSNGLKEG